MSCCFSDGARVAPSLPGDGQMTRTINRTLEQERKRAASIPVALFLGIGDSGKSTFCKQLRILHGAPYAHGELVMIRQLIHDMIVHDMYRLVAASSNVNVIDKIAKEKGISATFAQLPPRVDHARYEVSQWAFSGMPPVVDEAIAVIIMTLWANASIRLVYEYRGEFHLGSHAAYFFDKIGAICQESWLPTEDDIVRWRAKTIGVTDQIISCTVNGLDSEVRIVDVGGQRSERRKWIHHFSSASIIMFVVGLSDYNQCCSEDNKTSRMLEALKVFEQICSSPLLANTGIVVFFNKCDMFREKLQVVPFKDYVDDYDGDGSYDSACDYMKALYLRTATRVFQAMNVPRRPVHFYFTTAVDRNNVQHVFLSVHDIMIRRQLKSDGLL